MTNIYDDIVKELEAIKPKGKIVATVGGNDYLIDYNFNPPKVTKLEAKDD